MILNAMRGLNWLWIAAVLTVTYVSTLVWWIGVQQLVTFASNQKSNEVGDFLSGTFAPLAFLWLLAAVITQRQELDETRSQFVGNQKVVDEQLKTINSQNALLQQQQHEQAEEVAKKNYRLSLFTERYAIYSDVLKLRSEMDRHEIALSDQSELLAIAERSSFVFGSFVRQYLTDTAQEIHEYVQFTIDNIGSWSSHPVEGGELPFNERHQITRVEAQNKKFHIMRKLSMESLRIVMSSSMTVSDD